MGWALGLAFVVPGAYFLKRGWVNAALAKRLGLLLFMGATHLLAGSFVLGDGVKVRRGGRRLAGSWVRVLTPFHAAGTKDEQTGSCRVLQLSLLCFASL